MENVPVLDPVSTFDNARDQLKAQQAENAARRATQVALQRSKMDPLIHAFVTLFERRKPEVQNHSFYRDTTPTVLLTLDKYASRYHADIDPRVHFAIPMLGVGSDYGIRVTYNNVTDTYIVSERMQGGIEKDFAFNHWVPAYEKAVALLVRWVVKFDAS